ncbi:MULTISPECIES: thioredoxin domain-containing protein [unclassified Paenibacillus]|nr:MULTISPECIES: thioredoxin domain-containing protein [unclassified Paenibacillus]MCM3130994.1 DsbA family protein [Paenibacillus sp. MER 78]SDX87894.1 Protein-disulfide isomerase [Paenibacillus sp. PDC88]SFS99220.1 Protein-disulfide isomerase [Paenibacillus sp. 453mf]
MFMNKKQKGFGNKVALITSLGFAIVLLTSLAIVAAWSDQEEVYPTYEDVKEEISVSAGDYKLDKQAYIGDPNAPVKVIEFIDYKCPYCKAWNTENFDDFKEKYIDTGKVQFFVINFSFLGPDSLKAAMVGEILWKQNSEAFWEYEKAIYENQGDKGTIWANEKFLLDLIEKHVPHGDAAAVKKSLDNLEGLYEVKEDLAITQANGVPSVPTFIVDSKQYTNPAISDLYEIIDSKLVKSQY